MCHLGKNLFGNTIMCALGEFTKLKSSQTITTSEQVSHTASFYTQQHISNTLYGTALNILPSILSQNFFFF